MYCNKCGLDLPPGVKQCPKCGMINEFENPAPQPSNKKRMIIGIIALAAIALLALLVAVIASRGGRDVTSGPEQNLGPSNVMSGPAPHSPGGNIMAGPTGKSPATPTPPSGQKQKPPQQVVDYLNFVKGVEKHRQMLLKDTTSALMLSQTGESQGLMDLIDAAMDPESTKARDPLKGVRDELDRQYKNWCSTLSYYDGRPAPPECREFSGAYRNVLYSEAKAIGDICKDMQGVNMMDPKDIQKLLASLEKMKGDPTIQAGIDQSSDDADAKLDNIVAQYDMQKPFDVPREQKTGGNIMGF